MTSPNFPTWILNQTVTVTCVSMDAEAVRSIYLIQRDIVANAVTVEFNDSGRVLINGVDIELDDAQLVDLCAIADATAANAQGMPVIGRPVSVPADHNNY